MSGIGSLSEQSEVATSDQFPIYSTINGQPRRVSAQALLDFIQDGLTSDVSTPFRFLSATVAELASDYPAASWANGVVYCSNGNSGVACLAVSNGTNWLRIAFGAAVSA